MARRKKNPNQLIREWEDIIFGSKIRLAIGVVVMIAAAAFFIGYTMVGIPDDIFMVVCAGCGIAGAVGLGLFAMGLHDWIMGERIIKEHENRKSKKRKRR